MAENNGGIGEAAGGGDGAQLDEVRAGGAKLENASGYELNLDLFDVGEGRALLNQRFDVREGHGLREGRRKEITSWLTGSDRKPLVPTELSLILCWNNFLRSILF